MKTHKQIPDAQFFHYRGDGNPRQRLYETCGSRSVKFALLYAKLMESEIASGRKFDQFALRCFIKANLEFKINKEHEITIMSYLFYNWYHGAFLAEWYESKIIKRKKGFFV